MSVKDVYKLGDRERVLVHVNEHNQPIKAAGGLCTRLLTTLLKQPNLCPPDAVDFREVKKCLGAKLLKEVREFSLPYIDGVNKVLHANFNGKYKNLMHRLKIDLLKQAGAKLNEARKQARSASNIDVEEEEIQVQYSIEELLIALDMVGPPPSFPDHQWEKFKDNMRNDKAKELSRKGKEARAE